MAKAPVADINLEHEHLEDGTSDALDALLDQSGVVDAGTVIEPKKVEGEGETVFEEGETGPEKEARELKEKEAADAEADRLKKVEELGEVQLTEEEQKAKEAEAEKAKGKKKDLTPEERQAALEAIDLDKVEPPAGISQKAAVNFRELNASAKMWKERATAAEVKVAEVETKLKSVPVPEDVTKELEDHRSFRRIFDAENSPEFKAKYDGAINTIDEDIFKILKTHNVPAETEANMRKVGLGNIQDAWWQDTILKHLPLIDRQRLERKLVDRFELGEGKAQAISEFATKREEFAQEHEANETKAFESYTKEIYSHIEKLMADAGVEWAKEKEIPAGATKEQRAQIEAHNKYAAEVQQQFESSLWPKTAAERAEIAAAAVASIKLANDLSLIQGVVIEKDKTIKTLETQLAKIKGAGKLPGTDVRVKEKEGDTDTSKMSDDDGIEANMAAAGL